MGERIGIVGAGSWGTALAVSLALSGKETALWARRQELVDTMRSTQQNQPYLNGIQLPSTIHVSCDLEQVIASSSMVVFATPSQSVRHTAERAQPYITSQHRVVSVSKGIENETLLLTSEVLKDVLSDVPDNNIGVLYGPSHAEEVARKVPSTVVAAAYHRETARAIQDAFMAPWLRVYINTDIKGVQVGGSVKNVMAIAAGISDGVGFGDNTKAAIVTRGISEIRRLGVAMGGQSETFSGLSGIGDLVVTCMSGLSRNRYLGEQIGQGKTLREVQAEMKMVAEGVRTTQSVVALAKRYDVEMPITEAVYAILFEGVHPLDAVGGLMGRAAKEEEWIA